MQQQHLRILVIVGAVAALLMVIFGVAYAKTIVVDGLPNEWVLAERVYEEVPEAGTPPDVEMTNVFFTNDQQNIYWRFDTVAPTGWDSQIGYLAICMDVQTLPTEALLGPCYADYVLKLEPGFGTVELWSAATGEPVPSADVTAAAQFTVTEVSIRLSDVGINLANCSSGCYINAKLVLDSSTVFPTSTGGGIDAALVDRVPDGGSVPDFVQPYITFSARVGAGSPTAVTLAEMTAHVNAAPPADGRGLAALAVLIGAFLLLRATGRQSSSKH